MKTYKEFIMIYYLRIGVLSENIRVPSTCSLTAMIGHTAQVSTIALTATLCPR